jgi:hypothetical protein
MRLRRPRQLKVAVILLTAIALLFTSNLRAQSPGSAFERGVAVLANGQTMEGHISQQDNKVIVRLESGSRIHLAQERVLFTAANLNEAYWELAARTGATDLEGQISVFQWCLRNELFEEGANHLLVLQESKIPARRLAALDFDLEAKKKRAEFRGTQAVEREKRKQELAKLKMKERARKERIETLIGGKTGVTIPDLHRVPPRPIRPLKHATPDALTVSRPVAVDRAKEATEVIDQFGNKVAGESLAQETVRQVSYEQAIFSSPAVATAPPAVDGADDVRRSSKPYHRAPVIESGFSVSKIESSSSSETLPPEKADTDMADPFDADYFNRRFATPAVDVK